MSPSTSAGQEEQQQRLPPKGHAARAVISTERRLQIWEQFYVSFKEAIPPYRWCTRQELVTASCSGETGAKFTVDELTEVIRGRKHKREAGVDSQKVNGEWLYRFIPMDDVGKVPAIMALPSPPPEGKRPAPSSTVKAKAKAKTKAKTKTKTKTKDKTKTTPKRNAPLRPQAKGPGISSPPPPPVAAPVATTPVEAAPAGPAPASRKRAAPSAAPATIRRQSGAKKPRPSPRAGGGGGIAAAGGKMAVTHSQSGDAGGRVASGMFRSGRPEVGESVVDAGGWNCTVM